MDVNGTKKLGTSTSDQLCLINSHKFTCGTVGVDMLLLGQDWVAVFPDVSCEEEAFFGVFSQLLSFHPFQPITTYISSKRSS